MRQCGLRQRSVRTPANHYSDSADSLASSDLMTSRLIEQLGAEG
ncbi:MAG: hypothetical protein JWQ67_2495 [Marmoricola sp.]|jgi:hypothetical protein|nr:hypothetical protein [Marmoricola sp.]